MAIYVYKTADGSLVSYCPNDADPVADAATLAKNGLTVVKGQPALGPTMAWDEKQLAAVAVAAPVIPPPPLATGSITINGVVYKVVLS